MNPSAIATSENTTPRALRSALRKARGKVKSFSIGSIVQPDERDDDHFTSPIVKVAARERIGADDDVPKKGEQNKRRKRNPFTDEEDARLVTLIHEEGLTDEKTGCATSANFAGVAKQLGTGRTSKQCRDRWKNYLRGGIKKGGWTDDEEELIKDMYATFGAKWTAMAKLLTHRTDSDIKNKWYSMKRKAERTGVNESVNALQATGARASETLVAAAAAKQTADSETAESTGDSNAFQTRSWGTTSKKQAAV